MRSKKLVWLLALILVAVLSFTLIGCDPEDDPKPEDKDKTSTELVQEVVDKLGEDLVITNPRTLNIDIQGSASLQENVENGLFWKYELVAKGNIKLSKGAKENDSNFRIEVNAYDREGEKSTLVSLLYESDMNKDGKYLGSYFYLTLPGQDATKPLKINAIALLKLIPGADNTAAEINITEYLGMALQMLTVSAEKVGDNSYKLNTSMNQIWTIVQEIVMPIVEDPSGLAEFLPDAGIDFVGIFSEIDKIVPEIFPGLTYKGTDEAGEEINVAVDSLMDMLLYVEENLPTIDIAATFNFDANDSFTGAELVADYRAHGVESATHKFILDIDALKIGAGSVVAYDEGYALTATERKAMAPTGNILTFSIDGKMTFVNGNKRTPYTIDINADINPFVLADGFDISKLGDIGSFSMIISDDTTSKAIMTLYINGTDKELIISYAAPGGTYAILNAGVYIGGEYSFEALGAIINAMSAPAGEATLMADEAAGQDVAGAIIKALFSRLNFDNLTTTGVVLSDMRGLVTDLIKGLNLDLGGLGNTMLPTIIVATIFDSASSVEIGVKEDGFKYGVCELANKADLELPGHSNGLDAYSELIDDTKAVSTAAVQTNYEYGESFTVDTRGASGTDIKNTFTISGKDKAGNNADYSAVYYGVQGYDPHKIGSQEVTVFYGINSMLGQLLNASMLQEMVAGLPQMLPLFGAHMFKINVTVYPPVDPANVVLDIKGVTTMFAFDDIAEKLNATLRYSDANGTRREVKVTNDMISCKKPVISNGSFEIMGKFTIEINYVGITISQNVTVNEVNIVQNTGDIAEINKTIEDQISAELRYYNERGEIAIEEVQLNNRRVLDTDGNVMNGILDADGKVIASYENSDKDFVVEYTYEFAGADQIVKLTYTCTSAKAIAEEVGLYKDSPVKIGPSIATNMLLTKKAHIDGKYVTYLKVKLANTVYTVTPVWDEENSKTILIPQKASVTLPSGYAPMVDVEFTKVGEFNTTTNIFDAVSGSTPFNLSANNVNLPVGEFQVKITLNGVSLVMPKTTLVRPLVIFTTEKDEKGSSLFGSQCINLQYTYTAGFDGCPEGTNKITMKWDSTNKKFIPMMGNVEIKESDFKFEMISNTMYDTATGEWITADYTTGDNGNFIKESLTIDGTTVERYRAYKASVKITIGGVVFEKEVFVNKNYVPSDKQ